MRSTRLILVLLCLTTGAALAGDHPVMSHIEADRINGSLSEAEALIHSLEFIFARDELPPRYQNPDAPRLPCATPLLIRADQMRPRLDINELARLDALLIRPRTDKATRSHISSSGRFRLTYETTGSAEVPDEDFSPMNGVPDYVDACAAYLDSSWTSLIDVHGFTPPPILAGSYYEVTFAELDGALGLTRSIDGSATATEIEILNDMRGLAWTQQLPDVTPDDIARMVCAHEFKHASQRAQSRWSEGHWVELDATWSQDIVFDLENDYRRYLSGLSVGPSCLSHPDIPLDDLDVGVPGLYEEMLWQIWMSEKWGVSFVREIWERRANHRDEAMLETYDQILRRHGSSLEDGFPLFAAWNFMTRHRAVEGLGYRDAAVYPAPPTTTIASYPASEVGGVDHLAAEFHYLAGLADEGWLTIEFDGQESRAIGFAVDVLRSDGGGHIFMVPSDDQGDAVFTVPVSLSEIDNVGIIVANPSRYDDNTGWRFTVTERTPPPLVLDADSLKTSLFIGTAEDLVLNLSIPAAGPTLEWTASLPDMPALAVLPTWVSIAPTSGAVSPDSPAQVVLSLDASELSLGRYVTEITVSYGLVGASQEDIFVKTVPVIAVVSPVSGGVQITSLTPMPSRDSVTITWAGVKSGEQVEISVHDLRGRQLSEDLATDGDSTWTWDGYDAGGKPLPSGRYMIRLNTPSGSTTASAILIR